MNPAPKDLIPLAAELIGTVRDFGPDAVAEVLAKVPDGRHDALAVVLAAMVDPDKTPAQLLAWMDGPVQSRTFEPKSMRVKQKVPVSMAEERRAEVARLTSLGFSITQIAERMNLTTNTVSRHRAIIRERAQCAETNAA